ncbi:unnamed protein product [Brassicogethes aeneus]|uniref:Uncharacterized protein n=1 Tax=Brassicogethes aeneus TaxID=1431903 RepID=A0A9P0FBJ0_BRAAE|nr:unnamed protein product [Brassicogethes aeneus]
MSSINSFRKHVKEKHSNLTLNTINNLQTLPLEHSTYQNNESLDDTFLLSNSNSKENIENNLNGLSNGKILIDSESFHKNVLQFVSCLYTNNAIPRAEVQHIVSLTIKLFNHEFVKDLENLIVKLLNTFKCNENIVISIQSYFHVLQNPFTDLSSEYKRFKYFQESGHFIKPQEFIIGLNTRKRTKDCSSIVDNKSSKGILIPLRENLKKIFELPNVFNKTIEYSKNLINSPIKQNFIQCELWQSKLKLFKDKIVFPLFIYFDDFETGNVLGSHSGTNKLGGVYASIPCFPPEFQSLTEYILLTQLFMSTDRKQFGNSIFKTVIEELNNLHNVGINIKCGSEVKTIYFSLGLCLGDNLGLNSMFGFVESFSANYFCRLCMIPKSESKVQCQKDKNKLRNRINYQNQLTLNDPCLTGIKENSIWNTVSSFHVTENFCVDIMHDILEGVCIFDTALILNYFIYDLKIFTLNALNSKIESFDYGSETNIPPKIREDDLKKKSIKMSASEMLTFISLLNLMIGPWIPENNTYWQLYLTLRKILEIILDKCIQPDYEQLLASLIFEHHFIYSIKLKQTLKPKHHNMVHYPHIMKMVGPLVHIWSMRFESKHRPLKTTANISCSKKNICLTLGIKNQLQLCYKLLCHTGFDETIKFGPVDFICPTDYKYMTFINGDFDYIESIKWVKKLGVRFKMHDIIVTDIKELPVFGEILDIIFVQREVFVIYAEFITLGIHDHFHAFYVTNYAKTGPGSRAPLHWHLVERRLLNEQPPHRWIGRKGPNNLALHVWSTHSTDLTVCDFFLWGFIKDNVYEPQDL